jgi:hypothetical protein
VIAIGTVDELKNRVGTEQVELLPDDPATRDALGCRSDGGLRLNWQAGRGLASLGVAVLHTDRRDERLE